MKINEQNLLALSQPNERCPKSESSQLSDEDCKDILREIDEGDFEVSDWEAGFIESCLDRDFFTEKQKNVILRLDEKYIRRTNK